MNKKQARELIDAARAALKLTNDLLAEIVAKEAWTPLGYSDFTAMWKAEFSEIPLSTEMRAAVVYEMFRSGATNLDAVQGVEGIGPTTADSLRSQFDNGVPADHARLSSRRRNVNQRRAYDRHIDLRVTESEYETVAAMAGEANVTIDKWVMSLIVEAIGTADKAEAV